MATLQLILVRHAKSSWDIGGLDDFHRPLNTRGLRDCTVMPAHLRDHVPVPDRLLVSQAVRAVQTAQAIAAELNLPAPVLELNAALYMASADDMLGLLQGLPAGVGVAMVVGHNPGMTNLHNTLSGESLDNMPTFGVAHLELDAAQWKSVRAGCGRVIEFLAPKTMTETDAAAPAPANRKR